MPPDTIMECYEFKLDPYEAFNFDSVCELAKTIKARSGKTAPPASDDLITNVPNSDISNGKINDAISSFGRDFKRSRRTEGSLKIENNYFSKYNEMFHKETEQNNPDSIHFVEYNNICSRRLIFKDKADFSLDDLESKGFERTLDGAYEFSTKYIKVLAGIKGSTMTLRSTPYHEFKSHLLATLNLLDHQEELRTLRAELQLTNLTGSKSFNTLLAEGNAVKFRIDVNEGTIETMLTYNLYFGTEMNQFLNPKYIDKIFWVLLPYLTPLMLPIDDSSHTNTESPITEVDDISIPPNAQLFYNAMIKNALSQPQASPNFEIPELETELLKFQSRTVNWLLNKESVQYNQTTNRCEPKPLLPETLIRYVRERLETESSTINSQKNDEIENKVSQFLNTICFGWKRVLFRDRIFWFNRYNSNFFTNEYIYKYVVNYFRDNDTPKSFPGQGILAEEMGLGKTVEVTALALLNPIPANDVDKTINVQLKAHGDLKPVRRTKTTLIIAPDSILKQWVDEVLRLAPSLAVTVYEGIGKYQHFDNNARLISDYLRMFDIVFTSYSVISRELDYAVYSSRNNLTRAASRKRKSTEVDDDFEFDDADDVDNSHRLTTPTNQTPNTAEEDPARKESNQVTPDQTSSWSLNSHAFMNSNSGEDSKFLDQYREMFQVSLSVKKPKIANRKSDENQVSTDFEKALQNELILALRHNKLPDIYHNNEYKSPLMFLQFWRVVLDEVQMVSSQVSRAFQSAALIPRYHSWGVSGTPIKKNLLDLHSVLSFLRYQPFSRANGKICWDVLTNINLNTNEDFVKLWSTIGLRHTKAMVHDDIKLPPQKRILMTIPFNAVEQENYNQILGECLSTICLDTNGNPVLDEWEPTPTILAYMRTWLTRLRQVCCNPQIGHLSQSFKRQRARNTANSARMVNAVESLKTLDHILDGMLTTASDDILSYERRLVQTHVEMAQLFEFILIPTLAQKYFKKASIICQEVIARTNRMLQDATKQLKVLQNKSEESKTSGEQQSADGNGTSPDIDNNDYDSLENANETPRSKERPATMTDNDFRELQRLEEIINQQRVRLRSWDIVVHKCFFLLGSSYFQLYDEEYNKKIKEKLPEDFIDLDIYPTQDFDHKLITSLLLGDYIDDSNFKDEALFKKSFVLPSLANESGGDDAEPLETSYLKHLERCYYQEAESIRRQVLKGSIANVSKAVETRIKTRDFFSSQSTTKTDNILKDNGSLLLPKSTKKFFKEIPIMEISEMQETIIGIKPKFFLNRVNSLVDQLNNQASMINSWMSELIKILCAPLLSFENDPNGEEYEKSIEDQDKASCYLHLLNKALVDRSECLNGKDGSSKTIISAQKQQEQRDFDMELGLINDKQFLNNLEEQRKSMKPVSKSSYQDLLYEIRDIETDLKDEERIGSTSANLEIEVLLDISGRLRTLYDNQKLSQVLFQKEISVNCNAVFNARIDYFKQLQQISDSVKMPDFGLNIDHLDYKVRLHLDRISDNSSIVARKLNSVITKFRYLKSLTKDANDNGNESDGDEFMCIICRCEITIGSLTPCGHKYCKDCLLHWMRSRRTCPMCKASIPINSIYNFTRYKPNLKANNIEDKTHINNSNGTSGDRKQDDNLFSIYQQMDEVEVSEIMQIELKQSYSSKVDMIVKQVFYLTEKDPKVQIVIFSQWQDLLYILAVAFKNMGISYLSSSGTLNASGSTGRPRSKYDSVDEFKNPENNITCFLLNAKAQASGLTLINATHIFLCEPLVNTSLELQAISRIHRIGQKNRTTVWMFAIENTVEESIVLLSTNKRLKYLRNQQDQSDDLEADHQPGVSLKLNDVNKTGLSKKISKAKDLSQAESMTLLRSEGIDKLVNRASGDGESVSNNDLWDAFFCATASKEMSQVMNLETMSKVQ